MVKSGLEGRASVAPERLAVHLGLALTLLAALVWTGLDAWAGRSGPGARRRGVWPLAATAFAAGVLMQCLMGALVAGAGGGRVDTDWPLMGGHVAPTDYWQGGLWATLAHGPAAVQFNHRLLAYGLLAFGATLAVSAVRIRSVSRPILGLAIAALVMLLMQAGLGVATLLAGDPMTLALLHQANAAVLLTVAVALAWRSQRL
jgi:cytochrome c oxidase assembly protein subunit 15